MSLLTKEQAAHVAYMRDLFCGPSGWNDEIDELVSIIDDLQARAPKQYTEQELREELNRQYPDIFGRQRVKEMRESVWIACARFLGALKAES